jgi:hypothetical protein
VGARDTCREEEDEPDDAEAGEAEVGEGAMGEAMVGRVTFADDSSAGSRPDDARPGSWTVVRHRGQGPRRPACCGANGIACPQLGHGNVVAAVTPGAYPFESQPAVSLRVPFVR